LCEKVHSDGTHLARLPSATMRWTLPGAFALLFSTPAVAATWHVATTGDDAAAGTSGAPWKTIQHAADRVVAGDTVVIHAGS
jgi:hypothetical protein